MAQTITYYLNQMADTQYKIQLSNFETLLTHYDKDIAEALGVEEDMVKKFKRSFIMAAQKNTAILSCEPRSIISSLFSAAQIGLEPNTPQQFAFLIPYKNNLTYQLGYNGLTELAYQTKAVNNIYAEAVFEGDEFDFAYGTDRFIRHKPSFEASRTKEHMTHVYAIVELATGSQQFVVMSKKDINDIADKTSKGKTRSDSPWNDPFWYVEMAKKTAVKRVTKYIPKSGGRLSTAIEMDNMQDIGKVRRVDIEAIPPASQYIDVEQEQNAQQTAQALSKERALLAEQQAVEELDAEIQGPDTVQTIEPSQEKVPTTPKERLEQKLQAKLKEIKENENGKILPNTN